MKKLLALFSCATVLLSLASCASTPAPSASLAASSEAASSASVSSEAPSSEATSKVSTQGTTISFWYCYTDKVQENNVNLTKEFNETVGKEQGITVNAEYQGDYATMSQKLKAAFVAGTAPAVTVMDTSMLKPFAASKVLAPLDTFITRDKVDISDFQPAFLTDSAFDGVTYSLPYLRSTPILYLNTTLLAQAGLDPKGPTTWEELATYAKTVKEKTGKFGLDIFADAWLFQSLMMAEGSSTYNDDATATNINSDAAKKIIKTINDMRDNGSTHVLASSQASTLLADASSQNCAMWFYSTGGLTTFIGLGQKNKFDVSVAAMPKGTQNACPTGGANLVMTSKLDDAQKESAWQFINWMTLKEQAIKASTTTGYLPSRISAASDPTMQAVFQKMPQFKIAIDQLANAGGRTVSASEANAEIVKSLDAIWVNKQDMNTTLAELQTKVDGILNQK